MVLMPYVVNSGDALSPTEFEKIVKVLLAHRDGEWNQPLAADELWEIHREIFESLFHEPPFGPIPEHLKTHTSVHRCVVEYEEKIEQLERWKVHQLELWLNDKVGKKFSALEKVYELTLERGEPGAPDRYWLKLIEERRSANQGGKSGTSKSR